MTLTPDDQIDLFVDLDGVLADFDGAVQQMGIIHGPEMNRSRAHMTAEQAQAKDALYARIGGTDFFRHLPYVDGAPELWAALRAVEPHILTAVPRFGAQDAFDRAARDKYLWVCDYLEPLPEHRFTATTSRDKPRFMKDSGRPQVLIDDREKNIEAWRAAGGIGVLHVEARQSIQAVLAVLGRA